MVLDGRRRFSQHEREAKQSMNLENVTRCAQIAFFLTTGTVAVLTYIRARRTVLSTVNAEYQKRVMDRLHQLSNDLYGEFDPDGPHYWAKTQPVHRCLLYTSPSPRDRTRSRMPSSA